MTTKRINRYDIRTPIWNGNAKKRMIGLAPSRMKGYDELHVQIYRQTNITKESIPIPMSLHKNSSMNTKEK